MAFGIVDVPSSLGLRPPAAGVVPGTRHAPDVLRQLGLHARLHELSGHDAARVPAGDYREEQEPGAVRNQRQLVDLAHRLAAAVDDVIGRGDRVVVVGGDCSILLGPALALRRRGRFGLVHVDGHTDFRHPGNSEAWGAVAGEDLAAVTGLHLPAVSDIDGLGPYIRPGDVVHLGCRDDDQQLLECRDRLGGLVTAREWREAPETAVAKVLDVVQAPGIDGFWVHLDVDVLDPSSFDAVDSPDPGGVSMPLLEGLVGGLWPHCVGLEVCIYDPERDPDRTRGSSLVDLLVGAVAAEA